MLAVFAAATGCGGEAGPPVVAANVVVTGPAAQAPMAAAYLDISNRSGAPVRITHVSSPEYESVEIHETVVEDDIARMRRIPALASGGRSSRSRPKTTNPTCGLRVRRRRAEERSIAQTFFR
jgi:copper(I)-binding protein